ncbi:MAG: hypothetical protein IT389_14200 [Nitrospira sp.]|nr:hypothetical protein [Nitrospira sp.]
MIAAIKQTVTVQPGGVIQIQSADLVPGSLAEIIIIPDPTAMPSPKLVNAIGSAPGGFASPADADAFIRRERDAWPS